MVGRENRRRWRGREEEEEEEGEAARTEDIHNVSLRFIN